MANPILRPKKRTLVKYNNTNGNYYIDDYDDPESTLLNQPQFKTTGERISEEDARVAVGDQRLERIRRLSKKAENKDQTVAISNLNSINTPEENRIEEAQRLYPGRMKMQADTNELIRRIKIAMGQPGGSLYRDNY